VIVTVTKVSSLNERANIAPRNVAPKNSSASGATARIETNPPIPPWSR